MSASALALVPDLVWLAFAGKLKPTIRITIDRGGAQALFDKLVGKGLSVERATMTRQGQSPEEVLYVARSPALSRALFEAEAPVLPGLPPRAPTGDVLAAHTEVGKLLGYPRCCVEAFLARLVRGVTKRADDGFAHEDFVAAEDAMSRTQRPMGRLNNLLVDRRLRLVPFYPCQYDCQVATVYADRANALVRRLNPAAGDALAAALTSTVVVGLDGARFVSRAEAPAEAVAIAFDAF